MVVRLLGLLMVGAAGFLFWRPRSFMLWTAKMNDGVFDREISRGERRGTVVMTYAVAAVLMMLGVYYLAVGTAGLPDV